MVIIRSAEAQEMEINTLRAMLKIVENRANTSDLECICTIKSIVLTRIQTIQNEAQAYQGREHTQGMGQVRKVPQNGAKTP